MIKDLIVMAGGPRLLWGLLLLDMSWRIANEIREELTIKAVAAVPELNRGGRFRIIGRL
jgi:hypothetical protein